MSKRNLDSKLVVFSGVALTLMIFVSVAIASGDAPFHTAFLHTSLDDHSLRPNHRHQAAHNGHHGNGCFVTTSAQNHARSIRHWRSPCPHKELKHMNPYHPPHHKMHYHHDTGSHHRHD